MTQEILEALRTIEDKIASADNSEKEIMKVMEERDTYHDWADKLARVIGGDEIGEHSNMNNPWANALEMAENGMPVKEPTAFNWTPEMCAIWPSEYRPTMSGLLAMYKALRDASVYDTSVPKPLQPINQITPEDDYYVPGFGEGWVSWFGGDPGDDLLSKIIQVKMRSGVVSDKRNIWRWNHTGSAGDVVAYRVSP